MNKRYIDFVPSKKTGGKTTSAGTSSRVSAKDSSNAARPVRKPVATSRSSSAVSSSVSGHIARQSSRPQHSINQMPAQGGTVRSMPQQRPQARKGVRGPVSRSVSSQSSTARRVQAKKPVIKPKGSIFAEMPMSGKLKQSRVPEKTVRRTESDAMMEFSVKDDPKFGVIEELNTRFVSTSVEKRPLGDGTPLPQPKREEAKDVKAKKLVGRRFRKAKNNVENPVEKSANTPVNPEKEAFKMPKSPFINQDKVVKRPLSKNVYQKKVEPPKEESHGTVTIISKPEKDKHVSLIVAIIITIILGAAAGTVAFLLLPK